MAYIPKVGDKVRLNAEGLAAVKLSSEPEVNAHINGSVVTGVHSVPCDDFDLYDIDLDGPLGRYMVSNMWVEPINPPHKHSWSTSGGAWSCACGATQPRSVGPGV